MGRRKLGEAKRSRINISLRRELREKIVKYCSATDISVSSLADALLSQALGICVPEKLLPHVYAIRGCSQSKDVGENAL